MSTNCLFTRLKTLLGELVTQVRIAGVKYSIDELKPEHIKKCQILFGPWIITIDTIAGAVVDKNLDPDRFEDVDDYYYAQDNTDYADYDVQAICALGVYMSAFIVSNAESFAYDLIDAAEQEGAQDDWLYAWQGTEPRKRIPLCEGIQI